MEVHSKNLFPYKIPFILILLACISEYSKTDIWLANHFYNKSEGWFLRDNWIAENLLHRGGRFFTIGIMTLLTVTLVVSFFKKALRPYKKSLIASLVGGLSGIIIIALLKKTTSIYSPWDLSIYNGLMPYIRIFDHSPIGISAGNSFPAGHASAGYALLCFYFIFQHHHLKHSRWVLIIVLTIGLLFGGAQQVRGAHFLSHDLITIAICWSTNYISFQYITEDKLDV